MINSDQNDHNRSEFNYDPTKNCFFLNQKIQPDTFNADYFDNRNKNLEFLQNVGLIKKEDHDIQNSYYKNGILNSNIDIKFEEIDEIALLNSALKSNSVRYQTIEEQNKTNAFIMQQIFNRNDEYINSLRKEKSRRNNLSRDISQGSSSEGKSTSSCDKTNPEKDLNSLLKLSKKLYYCEVCEEQFDLKRDYKVHQLYHSGKHPYTCEVCYKKFIKLSDLNKHKVNHSNKQYICDQCEKGFTTIYSLAQHEKIHTGNKTHICTVCNKSFLMKGQLLQHSLTHTNIRPYSCFICDKRFLQMSHLKQHKLTHTGVKTFNCEFCLKSFLQKGHLNQHIKTHTGDKEYECEICSKKFTQKGQLAKHKNVHTLSDGSVCQSSAKSTQWTIEKLLN